MPPASARTASPSKRISPALHQTPPSARKPEAAFLLDVGAKFYPEIHGAENVPAFQPENGRCWRTGAPCGVQELPVVVFSHPKCPARRGAGESK